MGQTQDRMSFVDMLIVAKNRWRSQLGSTWVLIFLIVLVKDLYIYAGGGMPTSKVGEMVVLAMMLIGFIILFSALLYRINAANTGQEIELADVYSAVFQRFLHLLILVFYYAIVLGVFYGVAWYASMHFYTGANDIIQRLLMLIIIVVLPCVYVIVLSLFSWPLILLDNMNVFKAIGKSMQMTWFHWLYVFNLYLLIGFVILVSLPGTMHGKLLIHYHLIALFDLLVLGITVPIICNIMILMKQELQRLNA